MEDDDRLRAQAADLLRSREAVEAGHVDVEQRDVGFALDRDAHGLPTVGRRRDDLELRDLTEHDQEQLEVWPAVVGNDDPRPHRRRSCAVRRRRGTVEPAAARPSASSIAG